MSFRFSLFFSLVSDEDTDFFLKDVFSFKNMPFKARDEMIEVFKTWNSKAEFKMEKYRDNRVRYLLEERYNH